MRKTLPEKGLGREEIMQKLNEYSAGDVDPFSGKLFTIAFEPGVEELRSVAFEAI